MYIYGILLVMKKCELRSMCMEKRSRISRYKELRDTMLETKIDSEDVLEVNIEDLENEKTYQPSREKVQIVPEFIIDDFHNEYLDEFIKEVKEYNIRKGNAFSEDTQLNVLQELKNKDDLRTPYIEEIDEFEEINYFDDISKQVAALLNETPVEKTEEVPTETPQVVENIVEEVPHQEEVPVIEEKVNAPSENSVQKIEQEDLLEETRKINLKIEEYKQNVETITTNVSKANTILNVVIVILIIFILIIIGLAVWFVLMVNK